VDNAGATSREDADQAFCTECGISTQASADKGGIDGGAGGNSAGAGYTDGDFKATSVAAVLCHHRAYHS